MLMMMNSAACWLKLCTLPYSSVPRFTFNIGYNFNVDFARRGPHILNFWNRTYFYSVNNLCLVVNHNVQYC